MRFRGERQVVAPVDVVWEALHEREVLRSSVPGCVEMLPLEGGTYAATLQARVGPVADTYRGSFSIEDLCPGSELLVRVAARGRSGRLEASLHVALGAHWESPATTLHYDAEASVGGLVSRLGRASLSVAGGHFTSCFFRELDLALRRRGSASHLAPA